jgi:hypothetical protein
MNKLSFTIRPAETDDAHEILDMQRSLANYCDYDMSEFGIELEPIRKVITSEPQSRLYIAREEYQPAGIMLCHRIPLAWSGVSGVYIEDLFVQQRYRNGSGLGKLLVAEACKLALEFADGDSERAYVRLDTSIDNNDATLGFYEHGLGMDAHNYNFRLAGAAVVELAAQAVTH